VSVAALTLFIFRGWNKPDNIINLKLLANRNFAAASLMICAFGLGLFGTIAMQPMMLERLLGYPADTTGMVMAPRAFGSAVSMIIVSRLIVRYDPRILVSIGLLLGGTGTYLMTFSNLYMDATWVVWPAVIQGLGLGMTFVPLSTLAYDTLPKSSIDEAAGLYNLLRTFGSSIGISIASTVLAHASQWKWNEMSVHISEFNPNLEPWLNARGLTRDDPAAPKVLANEVLRQSSMVAFVDVFWMISMSFIIVLPLVLLMRRPQHQVLAKQEQKL
jgi:DHA2 family multidrug resistance protein